MAKHDRQKLPDDFKYWIYSSRALAYLSLVSFLTGLTAILLLQVRYHQYLMIYGIRTFYSSIMWVQIPGYTGKIPPKYTSLAHAIAEGSSLPLILIGSESWLYPLGVSTAIHLSRYHGAIKPTKLHSPNTLTVIGLLATYTVFITNDIWALAYFPLLSAVSLLSRVDPSMRGYTVSVERIVALATIALVSTIISVAKGFEYMALLLGSLPLVLPGFRRVENIYLKGSTTAKAIGIASLTILALQQLADIAILDLSHLIVLGFLAVVMSSLCAPYLLPSILWRRVFEANINIPYLLLLSAVARAVLLKLPYTLIPYTQAVSATLAIGAIAYYTFNLLKSKKVM